MSKEEIYADVNGRTLPIIFSNQKVAIQAAKGYIVRSDLVTRIDLWTKKDDGEKNIFKTFLKKNLNG